MLCGNYEMDDRMADQRCLGRTFTGLREKEVYSERNRLCFDGCGGHLAGGADQFSQVDRTFVGSRRRPSRTWQVGYFEATPKSCKKSTV